MVDSLGNIIYSILYYLRDMFQRIMGYQLNIDFNSEIMLGLFIIAYVISFVIIVKIIVGVVRWFYRI